MNHWKLGLTIVLGSWLLAPGATQAGAAYSFAFDQPTYTVSSGDGTVTVGVYLEETDTSGSPSTPVLYSTGLTQGGVELAYGGGGYGSGAGHVAYSTMSPGSAYYASGNLNSQYATIGPNTNPGATNATNSNIGYGTNSNWYVAGGYRDGGEQGNGTSGLATNRNMDTLTKYLVGEVIETTSGSNVVKAATYNSTNHTAEILLGTFLFTCPANMATTTITAQALEGGYNVFVNGSATPLDSAGGTDSIAVATAEISAVPEPSSVAALCGLAGIGGLAWLARRHRRARIAKRRRAGRARAGNAHSPRPHLRACR